jgi:diacylglycerol kinase
MPFYKKLMCLASALRFAWRDAKFRIWVVVCTLGIVIGLIVGVGMTALVLLVAIACLGWGLEIANTSIETLCNIIHPDYSPKVKIVKDAFSAVPIFAYSAYVICWLILVAPTLWSKLL